MYVGMYCPHEHKPGAPAMIRFLVSILVILSGQAANASEPAFFSQCHKLLPIADEFADRCLRRARSFSRTFYPGGGTRGEVESYSTYFHPLEAPSHFVLGCVLDFKHKINFAGLYYSAKPLDMNRFEEYGINFIDPNDNVGLEIEGASSTLVAIRQFVTDIIPARLAGQPKNCEEGVIETTDDSVATGYERVRQLSNDTMEICVGVTDPYCRELKYLFFVEKHQTPIVYSFNTFGVGQFLIDGNGAFMVQEQSYGNKCAWRRDSASIFDVVREMCSQPEKAKGE
jgi:hypothetical protein